MAKRTVAEALVTDGPQGLFVAAWTRDWPGLKRHVALRIGEMTDSQLMRLTPSEARRVAIALLEAADEADAKTN